MKKILLVYPKVPVTYWSYKHALAFTGAKTVMQPLGLLTIAAMIPDSYELRLVDCNVREIEDEDILWADLVMVSAMIVQKKSFADITLRCAELGVPVAAGGPYPSSSYTEIGNVDYFILDEGEMTLPPFLSDYEKGVPRHVYRSDVRPDLTETPIPRFDLIDHRNYSSIAIQNSRGCPYNCEFCDIIELFGRKPRYKNPDQVYAELEAVYNTGFRESIFIVDDNFIGNKSKAKALLHEIVLFQITYDYPFTFYTEASVDLAMDDELLELMADAAFSMVFLGIETPDNAILEQANKSQNTRQDLLASVEKIQRTGIQVLAGFILGFDNETPDIFERQIRFIEEAAIPHAMIGLMLALPNTQLYRRLEKEGRILARSSGNNTHELGMNFVPTLPVDDLVEGYKGVIKTIYSPKEYFKRSLAMLGRMPRPRFAAKKTTPRDLMVFFRSFLVQLFSKYGLIYLKYLFTGFIKYPHHRFYVVELAVKGHHFFKITAEILKVSQCEKKMKKCIAWFDRRINSRALTSRDLKKIYTYRKTIMKRLDRIINKQNINIRENLTAKYKEYKEHVELITRRKACTGFFK